MTALISKLYRRSVEKDSEREEEERGDDDDDDDRACRLLSAEQHMAYLH